MKRSRRCSDISAMAADFETLPYTSPQNLLDASEAANQKTSLQSSELSDTGYDSVSSLSSTEISRSGSSEADNYLCTLNFPAPLVIIECESMETGRTDNELSEALVSNLWVSHLTKTLLATHNDEYASSTITKSVARHGVPVTSMKRRLSNMMSFGHAAFSHQD